MTTPRYLQFVSSLPKGPTWDAAGHILPLRSGTTALRLETTSASAAFNVFINQVPSGQVTTDTAGIAILNLQLPRGHCDIRLVRLDGASGVRAFVDVRETATWHAAYADVIETLDTEVEDIYDARAIRTCPTVYIEDVHGRLLQVPNEEGYTTNVYRNIIEDLRQAYRHFGGIARGLRLDVEAFTSSAPLVIPDKWRPTWIVGSQVLSAGNGTLQQISRTLLAQFQVAGVDLPNINTSSRSWIRANILDNSATVSFSPTRQPLSAQRLTVTAGGGWAGGTLTITGTDLSDTVISEIITPSAGATVNSSLTFKTVTLIVKQLVAGAGAVANVGLYDSRYLRVKKVGSYNIAGSAVALAFNTAPTLTWNSGTAVSITNSQTYIKTGILANDSALSYTPTNQPPSTQLLIITVEDGWSGGPITITGTGAADEAVVEVITLPVTKVTQSSSVAFKTITSIAKSLVGISTAQLSIGVTFLSYQLVDAPRQNATLYTRTAATYNLQPGAAVVSDQTDQLFLQVDNKGIARINLSGVAVITAATANEVRDAINNTLNADTRYGASYNAVAATITGTDGVNTNVLRLRSPTSGTTGSVTIEPGPCDAARATIGWPDRRTFLSSGSASGTAALVLSDAVAFPSPDKTALFADYVVHPNQILGVTLDAPSTSNTLGFGNIKLTTATLGLQYQAPTDGSFGTSIVVSAGGTYTLTSNNGTDTLVVTVDGVALQAYSGMVTTFTDQIEVSSATQYKVRVRGRRLNAADGVVTADASPITCAFVSAGSVFVSSDLGGHIRISGAAATNNGIHRITQVTNPTTVQLHHERNGVGANSTFANAATLNFTLWSNGEVHKVRSKSVSTLTLIDNLNATWPSGGAVVVEYDGDIPVITSGTAGIGTLDIEVSSHLNPGSNVSDNVTPQGGNVPDGWRTVPLEGAAGFTAAIDVFGRLNTARFIMRTNPGIEMQFYRVIPGGTDYKGLPLTATFWVRDHSNASGATFRIDTSMDGGSTWVNGSNLTTDPLGRNYTGEPIANATKAGPRDPQAVTRTFWVLPTATALAIRLVRVLNAEAIATFSIEEVNVTSSIHSSLFMGSNTIPREPRRSSFLETIYVWSPEVLTTKEKARIGLPSSTTTLQPDVPGQIDLIMPAHEVLDRANVSEYDASSIKVNLVGAYDDVEWSGSTLTNMDVVVGTPARLTYARPTRISKISGEVLAMTAGDSAPLSATALYEGAIPSGTPDGNTRLYETTAAGIVKPLPDSPDASAVQPWNWIASNRVHVDAAYYTASSAYSADYPVMMRAETPVLSLPATFADYLWLTDAAVWTRTEPSTLLGFRSEQLQIRGDFTAILSEQSDEDKSVAELIKDNGISRTIIPSANWSFVNGSTVRIDAGVFDNNSIFSFTYRARILELTRPVTYRIDIRSAALIGNVTAATYTATDINQPIGPSTATGTQLQFHQMRITFFNVIDVRDVRLYGLGIKGIHLFGGVTYAPGLLLP